MAESTTYVRFRLNGTIRVLGRVIESGETWADVEVVGSHDRVRLTGAAWTEAKLTASTDKVG